MSLREAEAEHGEVGDTRLTLIKLSTQPAGRGSITENKTFH